MKTDCRVLLRRKGKLWCYGNKIYYIEKCWLNIGMISWSYNILFGEYQCRILNYWEYVEGIAVPYNYNWGNIEGISVSYNNCWGTLGEYQCRILNYWKYVEGIALPYNYN